MSDQKAPPKEKTFWYTCARAVNFILTHTVYPVTWHMPEHFSDAPPAIIVSNHKHWLDPLLIGSRIKTCEVRFLGKKELVKTRLGAFVLDKLHMIVVDRHNSDLKAMRECVNTVREGHILAIFPEGTRCRDTTLEHMESGCAMIALRCKVPVIPVLIDRPCGLFRRVHVRFGRPIPLTDLYEAPFNNETAAAVLERMREGILSLAPKAS